MQEILQLNIVLEDSDPGIWRRILVHKDTSFFELHHIIQISMGWKNYHLFEFKMEGYRIGIINEEFGQEGFGADRQLDCKTVTLADLITQENDHVSYEYDFGDGWKHNITMEQFLEADAALFYPQCQDGQLACPPEDCGGIYGYYENLEILKDKKHPAYRETKQWLPRGFDPNKFDAEKVNKQLNRLDQYIARWLKG